MIQPRTLISGGVLEDGDLRLLEHCSNCFAALDANAIVGDAASEGQVQVGGRVQEKCMSALNACGLRKWWAVQHT